MILVTTKIEKIITILLVALAVVSCFFENTALCAQPAEILIIMENSSSFEQSDPDRHSVKGMELLIKLLDANDVAGLIHFAEEPRILRQPAWIGLMEEKATVVKSIHNLPPGSGKADMEKALEAGLKTFSEFSTDEENSNRAVIFLTDGGMELGDFDRNEASRNNIISKLLPEYKKRNTAIYSIGFGPKVDRELLAAMGSLTDGFYFYLDDPKNITDTILDIFNEIKTLDSVPMEGLFFNVSEGAEELLTLADNAKADGVYLVDPQGERIHPDSEMENLEYMKHGSFDIFRIAQPAAGRWRMHTGRPEQCRVYLHSDLNLNIMPFRRLMFSDENLLVAAHLSKHGKILLSPRILDETIFRATLLDKSGKEVEKLDLKPTKDGIFAGTISLNGKTGLFRFCVSALSNNFTRYTCQLSHVVNGSWLNIVAPQPRMDFRKDIEFEVQLLSDVNIDDSKYEMNVQISKRKKGSWVVPLERQGETRLFRGRLDDNIEPGTYQSVFFLRRFANAVAEEIQVRELLITIVPPPVKEDKTPGWLLFLGALASIMAIASGVAFFIKNRRLKQAVEELEPDEMANEEQEEESQEEAVEAETEQEEEEKSDDADDQSTERFDPLEELTRNLEATEVAKKREPKLAMESKELNTVIDQVSDAVKAKYGDEAEEIHKVSGEYSDEEEVVNVSGNTSAPNQDAINNLMQSLGSKDETEADAGGGMYDNEEKDDLAIAASKDEASSSRIISGQEEELGSVKVVGGEVKKDERSVKVSGNVFENREKLKAPKERKQKSVVKSKPPEAPKVETNELDSLLQQARESLKNIK